MMERRMTGEFSNHLWKVRERFGSRNFLIRPFLFDREQQIQSADWRKQPRVRDGIQFVAIARPGDCIVCPLEKLSGLMAVELTLAWLTETCPAKAICGTALDIP